MKSGFLALRDGTVLTGEVFGATDAPGFGELVFNTSMTGYQEILSDPSYSGQIVTLTMPHIGNYGVNVADMESPAAAASGVVVRSVTEVPSNWRSQGSLEDWLRAHGRIGIANIDTRSLTRRLRDGGVIEAVIASDECTPQAALAELEDRPRYAEVNWVSHVTSTQWQFARLQDDGSIALTTEPADGPHVVVLDFGVKHSILKMLLAQGLAVRVAPPTASAKDIVASGPNGVLVSNGPGDPAILTDALRTISELSEQMPVWGICLGHQLIARAFGAETFKLHFGHRGPNQPVFDHATGRVLITSQNHGYAVDAETLPDELEVTQYNLNDGTIEGIKHRARNVVAVQYHPEAGPGPHDAVAFFEAFSNAVRN